MPSVGLRGGMVADRNGPSRPIPWGEKGNSGAKLSPGMGRMMVVLTYWGGDRDAADRLVRFLADIEPGHNRRVDFLLMNRFDTPPLEDTKNYLARKFNTFSATSPVIRTGWPDGCNALVMSAFDWIYKGITERKLPHYKAIFNCEADGAPLVNDWTSRLSSEWDRVNKTRPVFMAGPWQPQPHEHINANAMLSGDLKFLQWFTSGGPTQALSGGGWDYVLASTFKHMGWADVPCIKSYYNTPHFTAEQYVQFRREGLVWIHGDKGSSLIDLGRLWLLEGRDAIIL